MTPEQFCYWLHGFFEIAGNKPYQEPTSRWNLSDSQVDMIKEHLASVFEDKRTSRALTEQIAADHISFDKLSPHYVVTC